MPTSLKRPLFNDNGDIIREPGEKLTLNFGGIYNFMCEDAHPTEQFEVRSKRQYKEELKKRGLKCPAL